MGFLETSDLLQDSKSWTSSILKSLGSTTEMLTPHSLQRVALRTAKDQNSAKKLLLLRSGQRGTLFEFRHDL
jgi:hypothetical protein